MTTAMTENPGSRSSWRGSIWLVVALAFVGVGLLLASRPLQLFLLVILLLQLCLLLLSLLL
jgi:hypothetical protein